jgi:hypothetical protein
MSMWIACGELDTLSLPGAGACNLPWLVFRSIPALAGAALTLVFLWARGWWRCRRHGSPGERPVLWPAAVVFSLFLVHFELDDVVVPLDALAMATLGQAVAVGISRARRISPSPWWFALGPAVAVAWLGVAVWRTAGWAIIDSMVFLPMFQGRMAFFALGLVLVGVSMVLCALASSWRRTIPALRHGTRGVVLVCIGGAVEASRACINAWRYDHWAAASEAWALRNRLLTFAIAVSVVSLVIAWLVRRRTTKSISTDNVADLLGHGLLLAGLVTGLILLNGTASRALKIPNALTIAPTCPSGRCSDQVSLDALRLPYPHFQADVSVINVRFVAPMKRSEEPTPKETLTPVDGSSNRRRKPAANETIL